MTAVMVVSLAMCAFVVGVAYGAGGTWIIMQRMGHDDGNQD